MIEGYYEKGFCYRSEKYKLIFVHVSKNATTSIKSIQEFEFVQDNILRYQKKELKKYKVFTIVRNPKKRFISAYLEVCSRASMDSLHVTKYSFYWCKNQVKRFEMFLAELEKGCFDVHLLPQYYFLTDQQSQLFEFDYILNLENLGSEFSLMQRSLGIIPALVLPKRNTAREKEKSSIIHLISNVDSFLRKKDAKGIPSCYRALDQVYRFLIRRKAPTVNEIEEMIENDASIKNRVEALIRKDMMFYNNMVSKE